MYFPKQWHQDLMSWSCRFSEAEAATAMETVTAKAGLEVPEVPSLSCPHYASVQFAPIWECCGVRSETFQAPDFRASHLRLAYSTYSTQHIALSIALGEA